MEEFRI